jgi:Alcohol dehydrogenase GroES-associated
VRGLRALTWQGNEHVEVIDVPDPAIQEPNDIVIRVTSTAIRGSDLRLDPSAVAVGCPGWAATSARNCSVNVPDPRTFLIMCTTRRWTTAPGNAAVIASPNPVRPIGAGDRDVADAAVAQVVVTPGSVLRTPV